MISPAFDFVSFEVLDGPAATAGGIHIPESARKQRGAETGRVLDVGPGRVSEYGTPQIIPCKAGEVWCFPRGAGISVDDGAMTVRLVRACELIGKVIQ